VTNSTAPAATAAAGADALIGRAWTEADTPVLVVDLDRLERNIATMAALARDRGLDFRPHFKTHKSVAIARRQMAAGALGMTVAKLDEATVLIDAGITDVLLGFEIVAPPKLARAMALAARSRLILAVDSIEGARAISGAAAAAGLTVRVWIEVESGLRRAGVLPPDAGPLAAAMASLPNLDLDGVFTHAGNAYAAPDRETIARIAVGEAAAVRDAADAIGGATGRRVRVISVGSTPTAELVAQEPGITELRPGNYAFYDAMQVALGTVPPDRPALTIGVTVVSRPLPERAIVDGGAKTFGLDKGAHSSDFIKDYGQIVEGGEGALARLSEEHGILAVDPSSPLRPGDHVRILPNHSCTIGNLGRSYIGVRNGIIEELISIDAAGGVH
jgi:D-serine deaminase-like pyridoxal phosphate-dependent protein